MAAATTTDDECRSAKESTSAQVARVEVKAPVDLDNFRKAKVEVDGQASERLRAPHRHLPVASLTAFFFSL